MNARFLLDGFDLLGDELETVQKLRKLIVVLAVTGKLTTENEAAIDPITLISQIKDKANALSRRKQLLKHNSEFTGSSDDLPIVLTNPRIFVRLGSIARIEKGATGIMKAKPGPYPLVVTAEERLCCDHFDFEGAAAIIPLVSSAGHGKASLQRLHYQDGKFALGSILAAVFPFEPNIISARFLFEYLTAFKEELLVSQMIGTANVSLSIGKLSEIAVPLVSQSAQKMVDQLMKLCDQLEAAKVEREQCRDSLVAASLQGLNQPAVEEETFREHARFAFNNLPRITTRTAHIKQLRQTILNLAVRGKLVEQDPGDEPAAELALMIKKRSRGQIQESIEPPFSLPVGWAWRAIDTLADKVTDGEHSTPPRIPEPQIPLVTAKNVREGYMDYSKTDWVSLETAQKAWVRCRPQVGDLLLVCVGATTGRLTVLREPRDMVLVRSVALIRPNSSVLAEFLERGIRSPLLQQQIWASVKAAAQPCLYINRIQSLLIPLPPLAEQQRIVAKVNELMAICDQLEAQITATEQDSRRFLESVLADALAPGIDLSAEAKVA